MTVNHDNTKATTKEMAEYRGAVEYLLSRYEPNKAATMAGTAKIAPTYNKIAMTLLLLFFDCMRGIIHYFTWFFSMYVQ